MNKRIRARAAIVVTGMLAVLPALRAHHSFSASFQGDRPVTLAGVVTKIEWANPHMYFYMLVRNDEGKVVSWICEAGGLNVLARLGWTRDLLKVGDTVKVIAYPARGGAPVASAREVVLNGGRKMVGSSAYDGGPEP